MEAYNSFYFDNDFYYNYDPEDRKMCFHYFLGLAFDYKTKDNLINELTNVLKQYDIDWFLPENEDYDYYGDPLNSDQEQDTVFDFLKPTTLYNYIRDMGRVFYKYRPVVIRSTDHRSFMELDNTNLDLFTSLYKNNLNSIFNNYFDYLRHIEKERDGLQDVLIITDDKTARNELIEMGYDGKYDMPKDNDAILSILLDFTHAVTNLGLKLVAKTNNGIILTKQEEKLLKLVRAIQWIFHFRKFSFSDYSKEAKKLLGKKKRD